MIIVQPTRKENIDEKYDYSPKYTHETVKEMLKNGVLIPLNGVLPQIQTEEKTIEEKTKQDKKEHYKLVRFVAQKLLKQFAEKGHKAGKAFIDISNATNMIEKAQSISETQNFKEKFKVGVEKSQSDLEEILKSNPNIEKDIKKSFGLDKLTP